MKELVNYNHFRRFTKIFRATPEGIYILIFW